MGFLVSILIVIGKYLNIKLLYNFLFLPFLAFIFISKDSKYVFSRKISFYTYIFLFLLILSLFILNNPDGSIFNLIFRGSSLTLFLLSLFGLVPFNEKVLQILLVPCILSIPAIFFIFNPPVIYRYSMDTEFIATPGLYQGFSLSGLFPTSLYMAMNLLGFLLFYFIYKDKFHKKSMILNSKILSIIIFSVLILFTNRKAYFFPLLIVFLLTPLRYIFLLIKKKFISKKEFFILAGSILLIIFSYFTIKTGVGAGGYNLNAIFQRISTSMELYLTVAITPNKFTFSETAMQLTNTYGGYVAFYLTYFLLTFSLLISLIKIRLVNFSIFILTYSYIFLFLFKEPQTIFSTSPSSLFLFMILSYQINLLHNSKRT